MEVWGKLSKAVKIGYVEEYQIIVLIFIIDFDEVIIITWRGLVSG